MAKAKTGRRPKSAAIETDVEVERKVAKAPHMRLQGKSTVFDESPDIELPVKEPDPLRPDLHLDAEARAEFAKLLRSKMSLAERADRLVELAHKNCTKTAAVGLRAITIINEITGVTEDVDKEAPSMFTLPEGATVSIEVPEPKK